MKKLVSKLHISDTTIKRIKGICSKEWEFKIGGYLATS